MSELKNKDNFDVIAEKPNMELIVGDNSYDFLPKDTVSKLDSKIKEMVDYMNSNNGSGKSNTEKDDLYKKSQEQWNELSSLLNDAKFQLILNKPEYIYMTNLLLEKMEYDVNLLFYVIELTNMLGNMKLTKDSERYTNDIDPISYPLTATDITYLYHVLQQHKVKGLKKGSYTFANIIRRIGDISKVFSYYDNLSKELSTKIQDWVVSFEDNISLEETKKETV